MAFYCAHRLDCSWLQLVGFWLQLVLLCVRLGTLYALVPLITIGGFFTVIIFFSGLLFWSLREPVPFARLCISFVLLVSSLYCKLVLLFLIYTFLTFDQKKKKSCSAELYDSACLLGLICSVHCLGDGQFDGYPHCQVLFSVVLFLDLEVVD